MTLCKKKEKQLGHATLLFLEVNFYAIYFLFQTELRGWRQEAHSVTTLASARVYNTRKEGALPFLKINFDAIYVTKRGIWCPRVE